MHSVLPLEPGVTWVHPSEHSILFSLLLLAFLSLATAAAAAGVRDGHERLADLVERAASGA